MGGVILDGNCAALLRFRQIMKQKKPHKRSSRTVPPTTPPTIGPTGVPEDEELDEEDEELGRGDPFKSPLAATLVAEAMFLSNVPLE